MLYTSGRFAVIELDFELEKVFKDPHEMATSFHVDITSSANGHSKKSHNHPLHNLTPDEFKVLSDTILSDNILPEKLISFETPNQAPDDFAEMYTSKGTLSTNRKLTRPRRTAQCQKQCNVAKETCKQECTRDGFNPCSLKESSEPIDTDSRFMRTLFCGNPEAEVVNGFNYRFKYCSGICTSLTRPKKRSKYSQFVNWHLYENSNACTPTGFETIDVLCSYNDIVYKQSVDDFMIKGCACGVVPYN